MQPKDVLHEAYAALLDALADAGEDQAWAPTGCAGRGALTETETARLGPLAARFPLFG